MQLGLNEVDTLESSSILIYYQPEQSLFTQSDWHEAIVIKSDIKMRGWNWLIRFKWNDLNDAENW
jgi:hypothetical protein